MVAFPIRIQEFVEPSRAKEFSAVAKKFKMFTVYAGGCFLNRQILA